MRKKIYYPIINIHLWTEKLIVIYLYIIIYLILMRSKIIHLLIWKRMEYYIKCSAQHETINYHTLFSFCKSHMLRSSLLSWLKMKKKKKMKKRKQ